MAQTKTNTFPWTGRDFFKLLGISLVFFFTYTVWEWLLKKVYPPLGGFLQANFTYFFNPFMLAVAYYLFIHRYNFNFYSFWGNLPKKSLVVLLLFVQSVAVTLLFFYPLLSDLPAILSFLLYAATNPEVLRYLGEAVRSADYSPLLGPILTTTFWVREVVIGLALVPFWEELLFRGIVQNYLAGKTHFWLAILLTAFVFALLHLGPNPGVGLGFWSALLDGVFYGYVYYRTRSLALPILLHANNNLVALLLGLIT